MGSSNTEKILLGDLDGDGDLDAYVCNLGQPNQVWLNDGTGHFAKSIQQLGGNLNTWQGSLGDLDGDHDLDVFEANDWINSQGSGQVRFNDGFGHFSAGVRYGAIHVHDVALGDLDEDGDLDAFMANDGPNMVWLNDGHGTFTDTLQSLGSTHNNQAVSLGDLDGDGDLDAFVARNHYEGSRVWLNDGHGMFTDSGQSLGTPFSYGVALGDLDHDGDLDSVVADERSSAKIWLDDGHAGFTLSQGLGAAGSMRASLGDVNGDGHLDVVLARMNGAAATVWLNDGTGHFTDSGWTLANTNGRDVALGDLDGDGDLDAFVGSFGGGNRVFINQGLSPQPTITKVEINQVLGSTTNYVADKDAPILVHVSPKVRANWYSQLITVTLPGGAQGPVLHPLVPSAVPTDTLTFYWTHSIWNSAVGSYGLRVNINGVISDTTRVFHERGGLRILAVPVRVKDRGDPKSLLNPRNDGWKTADALLRQVYPVRGRTEWC